MRPLLFLLLAPAAAALAADYPLVGPKAVVLRVKESPLAGTPKTVLEIFADGRVRHRGKFAATRMTKNELQDLLRFAIETHKFFEYDAAAVKRALKAREGQFHCGTGAVTTHIVISVRDKKRQASLTLLASRAATHKDIKDLAHLNAIHTRLHFELKLAQSGGRAKVASYLHAANQRLKQRHPKIKPLTIEEFTGLTHIRNSDMVLTAGWDPNLLQIFGDCAKFMRRVPGKVVHATVKTDPKAKPRAAAHAE